MAYSVPPSPCKIQFHPMDLDQSAASPPQQTYESLDFGGGSGDNVAADVVYRE